MHWAFWRAAIIAAVILLGVMPVSIILSRGISTPLKNLTEAVKQVADGALGAPAPGTEREAEIGELAKATEVFRENALRMEEMNEERQQTHQQTERNGVRARKSRAARTRTGA